VDFTLTDDQHLLRDTTRTLLTKECPTALVRAHIDDPDAALGLWEHLRAFSALAAGPAADLALFLHETGYAAAPGPFFPTVALFAPLVAAVDHELSAGVRDGEVTGTVAIAGPDGSWLPNDAPTKTMVLEADRVDLVAVVSAGSAGNAVTIVPRAALGSVRRIETVDFSRRAFAVSVDPSAPAVIARLDDGALTAVFDRWHVALAAEMVGTAQRIFDLSVAYAKTRHQFDRPIGSFQAIQHKLADMALALERATAAVQYAAMTVDADDRDRTRACHVAKAAAGDAARRILKDGAQVHGGIGYTWEHDLHLFLRRATGDEYLLGTTCWHHDRIADLLFA
jgi:alkylation response protein AidB-like acyl-CoA dehydrogenase